MTSKQQVRKQDEEAAKADVRRDETEAVPEVQEEPQAVQVLEEKKEHRVIPSQDLGCVFYRYDREVYPAFIGRIHRHHEKGVTVDSAVDLIYLEPSTGRSLPASKVVQGLGNRQWWVKAEALSTAVALEYSGRTNQS